MIGLKREALIDPVASEGTESRFNGPLAMLGLILAMWITGRVVLWENPFAAQGLLAEVSERLADADLQALGSDPGLQFAVSSEASFDPAGARFNERVVGFSSIASGRRADQRSDTGFASSPIALAQGHHDLWRSALTSDSRGVSWRSRALQSQGQGQRQGGLPVFPGNPSAPRRNSGANDNGRTDRWSLGAWAFFREGSRAAPISEGRVPVYGASQIGSTLQYRVAPSSGRDPRLYLRAYRALIERPESEIAMGFSARPMRRLPLRLAAELRATDNSFESDARPAVYAITEIPPIALPLGASAEIYTGGGYVGGEADTSFIDGQVSVVRKLTSFDLRKADDVRISLGAGAWGGAQRGANRLDVGPTMRVDLSLGTVPARVSIDYRERVSGDAAPVSGLAATVSTQF